MLQSNFFHMCVQNAHAVHTAFLSDGAEHMWALVSA